MHVTAAKWDGGEGATHFTFSDGSSGVQHFVKSGNRLIHGELHNLTPEQHKAVVNWIDKGNIGKGSM